MFGECGVGVSEGCMIMGLRRVGARKWSGLILRRGFYVEKRLSNMCWLCEWVHNHGVACLAMCK